MSHMRGHAPSMSHMRGHAPSMSWHNQGRYFTQASLGPDTPPTPLTKCQTA